MPTISPSPEPTAAPSGEDPEGWLPYMLVNRAVSGCEVFGPNPHDTNNALKSCGMCQGDCRNDRDCTGSLVCGQNPGRPIPPGPGETVGCFGDPDAPQADTQLWENGQSQQPDYCMTAAMKASI